MKIQWIRKKPQSYIVLTLLPMISFGLLLLIKSVYAEWVMPHVPPCFLRTLTGYKCPGCGMTHAVFAICRGDILTALRENAALFIGGLLLILLYAELWFAALGRAKKIIPRSGKFWAAALGMWFVYCVVRNLF